LWKANNVKASALLRFTQMKQLSELRNEAQGNPGSHHLDDDDDRRGTALDCSNSRGDDPGGDYELSGSSTDSGVPGDLDLPPLDNIQETGEYYSTDRFCSLRRPGVN